VSDTIGDRPQSGEAERERSTQSYRRSVRTTGVATVAGVAVMFVVNSALPGTTANDRIGLLVTAALVLVTGTVWFGLIPHSWFGSTRVLTSSILATLVLLVMVVLTGGVQSPYVGYLVIPAVVLILEGSAAQMLILAAVIFVGLGAIVATTALGGTAPSETAPARLLMLATVIGSCAAVAWTTGRHRTLAAERAAGLADESAAAKSLAMTDALTGLPNRRLLESHVERFAADSARTGLPFTVVALDLDGLKKVNDELGHDAGDAVLRQFGQSIDRVIRGSDMGVRTGGDEFVLLLPSTSEVQARGVVERLYAEADQPPARYASRFSYGIASLQSGESGPDLLVRADAALNALKRERRAGR
jgi:diguanylate cyclase (GGDEF)-like protein